MIKARRVFSRALAGVVLGLFLCSPALQPRPQTTAQEPPPKEVQKPSYDYMSTFLSRSTHPLGIKEDPATRRMMGQGSVPWAIRAGSRHILD